MSSELRANVYDDIRDAIYASKHGADEHGEAERSTTLILARLAAPAPAAHEALRALGECMAVLYALRLAEGDGTALCDEVKAGITNALALGNAALAAAATPAPTPDVLAEPTENVWTCKIGGVSTGVLPLGADGPMRDAVKRAYRQLTGEESRYLFSGWGGSLTPTERQVVEGMERRAAPTPALSDYARGWRDAMAQRNVPEAAPTPEVEP